MFEILLDENSEKEKREKVRSAPALPKLLLFNARGPCEELKAAFPSPMRFLGETSRWGQSCALLLPAGCPQLPPAHPRSGSLLEEFWRPGSCC